MTFVYCDILIPDRQNDDTTFENATEPQLVPLSPCNDSSPIFKLPFPPIIDATDFLANTKRSSRGGTLRSPNAFLIYRKAFLDHLVLIWKDFKTSACKRNKQNSKIKKTSMEKIKMTKKSNESSIIMNNLEFVPENVVNTSPISETTNWTWVISEEFIPSRNSTPCSSIMTSPEIPT
ncbi:7928_t:CDS:2, partial [Scutellospora calospora]